MAPGADEGRAIPLDQDTFSSPVMRFLTRFGEVDVVRRPAGVDSHADLDAAAVVFDVGGLSVRVAGLATVIAPKVVADRPKDRVHLGVLRQLADEVDRRAADRDDVGD